MKISNILVSQPAPGNTQSPFSEITSKYGVQVDYFPFFRIEPLTAKEFRTQKVAILDYTAIFFSAKSSIDAFFSVCEAMRVTVPETMKYFCTTENIALYLQKHIVYRKRKIFRYDKAGCHQGLYQGRAQVRQCRIQQDRLQRP